MSFLVAAIWSISALVALDIVALVVVSMRSSGDLDLVSRVLCQGVAFLGTLYLMAVAYDRERPVSEALGLRRAPFVLNLMAVLLGVTLQGPLNLISGAIYSRYPPPEEQLELMRGFFDVHGWLEKGALVIAAGVLGPVVEEMFFRGGILRALLRQHPARLTLIGTSLLFAAAHRDWRNFLPDFLGGLAMGYVRLASGSLWPAILMHASFNTAAVSFALVAGPEADMLTRGQSFVAMLATVALVAAYGMAARRSDVCAAARAEDAT